MPNPQNRDEIDDYKIVVDFVQGKGFRTTLRMAMLPAFEAYFDNLPTSYEKAMSAANRLAEDLGCRLEDLVPRKTTLEQRRAYVPNGAATS